LANRIFAARYAALYQAACMTTISKAMKIYPEL
jgi:hypothetical protein